MRHNRWQALVMVAFAWVLWWGETKNIDNGNHSWQPLEAHDSKNKCENEKKKIATKVFLHDKRKPVPRARILSITNMKTGKKLKLAPPRQKHTHPEMVTNKIGVGYYFFKRDNRYGTARCLPATNIDPRSR